MSKKKLIEKPDPAVWWLVLERVENPKAATDHIVLIAEHRYTGERKIVAVIRP